VITGGEPLLQQTELLPLATLLVTEGRQVEVETNGTILPADAWQHLAWEQCSPGGSDLGPVRFIVSPKLPHAGMPTDVRIRPDVLKAVAALGCHLKFVVECGPAELIAPQMEEVGAIVDLAGVPAARVWLMPQGVTPLAQIAHMTALVEWAIRAGFNLSPRLQTLMWGDRRGR